MERLTEKYWRNLDPWECCGQDYYCKRDCHEEGGCANGCIVPKVYDRLAKYEDTGLTPGEVSELASPEVVEIARLLSNMLNEGSAQHMVELFEAEQDGRLVVLPCRTGAHVWVISAYGKLYNPPKDGYITKFLLHDDELMYLEALIWMDLGDGKKEYGYGTDNFGKIVFLTREEAEATLKEWEGQ